MSNTNLTNGNVRTVNKGEDNSLWEVPVLLIKLDVDNENSGIFLLAQAGVSAMKVLHAILVYWGQTFYGHLLVNNDLERFVKSSVGLSHTQFRYGIRQLVSNKILIKITKGNYQINPDLFAMGRQAHFKNTWKRMIAYRSMVEAASRRTELLEDKKFPLLK